MHGYARTFVLFATALVALALAGVASAETATEKQAGDGYDTATAQAGGWSGTTPGVAGRPFIKRFAITNGGVETVVIDNPGGTAVPTPAAGTDIYAFVSPTNACRVGQAPTSGQCYAVPNRVGIGIQRQDGQGWTDNLTGATTTPAITEASTIEIVIGFQAAYSSLRWTWLNGEPTYWSSTVNNGAGGDVTVRIAPSTAPQITQEAAQAGCSRIPVETCDVQTSPSEQLRVEMVLSMDDTLDPAFAGSVFASKAAFIGSLDSSPIQPGAPVSLTYGIAAPSLLPDGSPRRGTFYALLPEPLLTLLGTSNSTFDPSLMSVSRQAGSTAQGTDTVGWSQWTAAANGTAGRFLTISDISFSAPKFTVQRASKLTLRKGKRVGLATVASFNRVRVRKGARLSATVANASRRICRVKGRNVTGLKPGRCRLTLIVKPKRGKATRKTVSFRVVR